jgi:hypothetical protein
MNRGKLAIATVCLALLAMVAQAATETPNAGSVDITYSMSMPQVAKQTMKGVVCFSGNKARVEQEGMPSFGGAQSQGSNGEQMKNVVIVDGDAMEAYALVPALNYAIKFKLNNPSFAEGTPAGNPTMVLDREKYPEGTTIKNLGTRKYQGKTVTVYSVTYEHEGQMTTTQVYVNTNGLPVYLNGKTGSISYEATFSNYKFGTQDPSLFKLPAGMPVMDLSQYERALSGVVQ